MFYSIIQHRERDQSIQDEHDAELEAARREADSFSFGPKHKFTNTRLTAAKHKEKGMKTRQEHMEFCKQRALEYVDKGNVADAYASMASDLQAHPETAGHIGIQLGMMQMIGGMLNSPGQMREFINGFN